ncbi:MAG: 50S ribosomal protein L24 [Minisyncoccales bacterium]
MKIHKDDKVLVITGKYKGHIGQVLKTFPDEKKVIVEGANIRKKRTKPQKKGEKGETVKVSGKIDVSNVKLICSKCSNPTRVGYKVTKEDKKRKKVRICKKCNKEI